MWTRRELLARICSGLVLTASPLACAPGAEKQSVTSPSFETVPGSLVDPREVARLYFGSERMEAVAEVGEVVLNQEGGESIEAHVLDLIEQGVASDQMARLAAAVRDDFDNAIVIVVSGWRLSKTEAGLAVLAADDLNS